MATHTQVSPVGRVGRAKHIQVPPDYGGGVGDEAGHMQVSDGRADGGLIPGKLELEST